MSHEPRDCLRHNLAGADYLLGNPTGVTFEARSMRTRRFGVRSSEAQIIGEVTEKAPDELRAEHPQIEWRAMAGMRDRLIHDYFGVDYEIVWDVVQNRIPELRREIASILKA